MQNVWQCKLSLLVSKYSSISLGSRGSSASLATMLARRTGVSSRRSWTATTMPPADVSGSPVITQRSSCKAASFQGALWTVTGWQAINSICIESPAEGTGLHGATMLHVQVLESGLQCTARASLLVQPRCTFVAVPASGGTYTFDTMLSGCLKAACS